MLVGDMAARAHTASGRLGRDSTDCSIAMNVLTRLDLGAFTMREVGSLSGGERQQVVLKRALAQQADIVLLDEPTTALDLGHQQDVLDLVESLRRDRGLTVVATLHDLTLAADTAIASQCCQVGVSSRRAAVGSAHRRHDRRTLRRHRPHHRRSRRAGDRSHHRRTSMTKNVRRTPHRTARRQRRTPPTASDRPEPALVNTGDGKGKSSAAFGVAMRRARDWPVAVIEFLKSDDWVTGEQLMAEPLIGFQSPATASPRIPPTSPRTRPRRGGLASRKEVVEERRTSSRRL